MESEEKIVLFQGNANTYPEDYIEIRRISDRYVVSEAHRDVKQVRVETEKKDEAQIYAIVIYMRLYDDVADKLVARNIRSYLNSGEEKKARDFIDNNFDNVIFSIGEEDKQKISLIETKDGIDVKFDGEYIVRNVTLSRGYVAFYNYCEKLKHIVFIYDEIQKNVDFVLNRERILRLYILGE